MEPRPKIKLPIPYEPPRKDLNQLKTLKKIDTKLESLNKSKDFFLSLTIILSNSTLNLDNYPVNV